jgi:ATP/maltotriose-dependent transcriptional regulator MalT
LNRRTGRSPPRSSTPDRSPRAGRCRAPDRVHAAARHGPDPRRRAQPPRGRQRLQRAERDLLDQARPFLIQAYRNSIRYSEALDTQTPRSSAPRIPDLEQLVPLGLTSRQAEVLQLLATGIDAGAIA